MRSGGACTRIRSRGMSRVNRSIRSRSASQSGRLANRTTATIVERRTGSFSMYQAKASLWSIRSDGVMTLTSDLTVGRQGRDGSGPNVMCGPGRWSGWADPKPRALLLQIACRLVHDEHIREHCSRNFAKERQMTDKRYVQPGWFTTHVFNRAVRRLTRWGLSVAGSRELRVRGRKSGEWRSTPVNLLTVGGERYLVAPRGTTQWVRNIRAAREGELRVGRRSEAFRSEELADEVKLPVL